MPLSQLNKEQYAAATASLGHNLIIASAGTGKTSTIVARIANLLNSGIPPKEILLLTFTNKAAAEMIERVGRFFDKKLVSQIVSGTFHSVGYQMLKKCDKELVLKQPKELKTFLRGVYEKRSFCHLDASVDPYQSSYLYDLFSLYQNSCVGPSFSEWLREKSPEHEVYFDIYEDIMREYCEQKAFFKYMDFDDLLVVAREKLVEGSISACFKEILVDEYQDTNTLQGAFVEAFERESLFCVGDYDQSIYAFNGADINIIGSFSQRYPGANIHTLNKNYRSSGSILQLANHVIENNPRLYPKALEVTRSGVFKHPRLMPFNELYEQYQGIAHMIASSSVSSCDIAVVYRNNSSADGIEVCLREQGVSCKRRSGHSFFDNKDVKVILGLMQIVVNPDDMLAFLSVFEYAKGVGTVIAKEIFELLYEMGEGDIHKGFFSPKEVLRPFGKRKKNQQLGLFEEYNDLGSVSRFHALGFDERFFSNPVLKHPKLTKDGAKFLYSFYVYLKDAKRLKNPTSLLMHIVKSELFESVKDVLATKKAIQKDGTVSHKLKKQAKEKIRQKCWIIKDLTGKYSESKSFLNALMIKGAEVSEGEGVNLLSVHASKGLEFKEVYLVDLMDNRFPNRKLMSLSGSLEEERRLFYVAATRAKDSLVLSYARYDKIKKQDFVPSIFLREAGLLAGGDGETDRS